MSQKYPNKKIIAVLPAYNAAKTLNRTLADIPKDWIDDIILVDDLSQDDTIKIARAAGLKTFCHQTNLGYGGNQKTCYQDLLLPLLRHDADAVFGSRMMRPGAALKGGMPWWKYTANIILSKLANLILGLRLTEYHSGFRAYSKKSLNSVNYLSNSNDFVFDTEIIIQLKLKKLRIQEIPISTHYFPAASSIGLQRSIVYGLSILKNLCKYILYKLKLKDYPQYH